MNNNSMRNPPSLGDATMGLLSDWGDNIQSGLLSNFPWLGMDLMRDRDAMGQSMLDTGVGIGSIAGVKAKTLNPETFKLANKMRNAGANRDEIWKATGEQFGQPSYFAPVDNKLRWEIDDSGATYHPRRLDEVKTDNGDVYSVGLIGDALTTGQNPVSNLVEAYPQLADTSLVDYPFRGKALGQFMPGSQAFKYPPSVTLWDGATRHAGGKRSTLLHELNHNIQNIEDFPLGGNPGMFAGDSISPMWTKHKAEAQRLEKLYTSPEYMADIKRSNTQFRQGGVEAKLDALEAQLESGDMGVDAYEEATTAINEKFSSWAKAELKTMTEVERLGKMLGPKKLTPQMQYKHLVGEADARAVQDRRDWPMADRIETPFWESYDVPEGAMTRIYQAKEPKGLLNE